MNQPISTLRLPKETISNLRENGFYYVHDILNNPEILQKYGIQIETIQAASECPETLSALDIWQMELENDRISTFCRALDDVLDGGFQCGNITELCGSPGSGKTQICMQTSVAVQLDKSYGGLRGRAIYVDTRSGLSTGRLEDLINGCRARYENLCLDADEILDGITIFSPQTADEVLSVICGLRKYLGETPEVRALIIDSLSFPVQCSINDSWQRTQFYFRIVDELQNLLKISNMAVIIVNELITQIDGNGEVCVGGAGGQLLAHRMNRRLMFTRLTDVKFVAHTLKIPTAPQISVPFQITRDGIRGYANEGSYKQ